jgi:hypothetical protein
MRCRSSSPPTGIIVRRGNCTFLDKAINAAKLNYDLLIVGG